MDDEDRSCKSEREAVCVGASGRVCMMIREHEREHMISE